MTQILIIVDAELRLEQLEEEKRKLDAELEAARAKVREAEEAQIILESQLVTIRPVRLGDRIRRTQSYIPPTKQKSIDLGTITIQKNNC